MIKQTEAIIEVLKNKNKTHSLKLLKNNYVEEDKPFFLLKNKISPDQTDLFEVIGVTEQGHLIIDYSHSFINV